MGREWFSAAELAALALPGMPNTRQGVALAAETLGWTVAEAEGRTWRPRQGRGGGLEFHVSALPLAARAKLAMGEAAPAAPSREDALAAMSDEEAWAWYERQPEHKKTEAKRRLRVLLAVEQFVAHGTPRTPAITMVAAEGKLSRQTIYNWAALVAAIPRAHWLPRLAPRHAGRREERAECHPAAWEWLKGVWLRPQAPDFEDSWRQLVRVAAAQGWALPSKRTLHRRLMALPLTSRVYHRASPEAVKRMLPAQQRDRSVFHALQAVNLDDHKVDVFVRWPDGKVGRPHLEAVQDIYSGMILAWRIDRSENTQAIRLAIGDVVEEFGIPEHFWFDNTRAAANKAITGGQPNRFRFKVREEDPAGLIELLGATVHFATPYHGQAKPIERAFREVAGTWAKDMRFAGAYTGNSPMAKPADYGSHAVPLAQFIEVIAERVTEHNARPGRTSAVCAGRSFAATFAESYAAAAARGLIKKAAPAQRHMFLLAAETLKIRQEQPALHFHGNRYFADFMLEMPGARVVARFDADALHAPIQVYDLAGRHLGEAECLEAVGFNDVAAAREYARKTKAKFRAIRDVAEMDAGMKLAQAAALLERIERAAPPPETKVVRAVFPTAGANALKAAPAELPDDLPEATRQNVTAINLFFGDRQRATK